MFVVCQSEHLLLYLYFLLFIQNLVNEGILIENDDGTYSASDKKRKELETEDLTDDEELTDEYQEDDINQNDYDDMSKALVEYQAGNNS